MTSPRATTGDQNAAVAAGFLGWMLDAFDFFLVVMVLKRLGIDFHTDMTSVSNALFVTLAMRPL
ncbi:MAG TPA: hypothetical protein VN513_06935, partial [Gemmatimonadales bacterium]|nr:hypothetical protein [Gemmatimonadales bacterium]